MNTNDGAIEKNTSKQDKSEKIKEWVSITFFSAIVLIALIVVVFVNFAGRKGTTYGLLNLVFNLAIILFLFAHVVYQIKTILAAGKTLLHIGPAANRRPYLFTAAFMLAGSFFMFSTDKLSDSTVYVNFVYWYLLIIYLLIEALVISVQIREKGIFNNDFFYKWEQIESYEWITNKKNNLALKFKTSARHGSKTHEIEVAAGKKEKAKALMEQHCPGKENA
jgi:predicted neutral ceramidase superfamily lipid hydrolase